MSSRRLLLNFLTLNPVSYDGYCNVEGLGEADPTHVTFTKTNWPAANRIYSCVQDSYGNYFVKFKTWYRKPIIQSGVEIGYSIANYQVDNTYQPYECFKDTSGNTLPYILVGEYVAQLDINNQIVSPAGDSNIRRTLSEFRTAINSLRAVDDRYQLYDYQIHCFLRELFLANCETMRFVTSAGSSGEQMFDYLGVKSLNRLTFADGIAFVNDSSTSSSRAPGTFYVGLDPNYYEDIVSTTPTNYDYSQHVTNLPGSSRVVSKMTTLQGSISIPTEVVSNSSFDTYYCDGYTNRTTTANAALGLVCYFGGTMNTVYSGYQGLYQLGITIQLRNTSALTSTRLCYRPHYND